MVQVREITIKAEWETFLREQMLSFYPLFQSWEWSEVEAKQNCTVFRLGIYDENNLVGICSIIDVPAKRGHFLQARHGPVLNRYSEDYLHALLSYLKEYAKGKNISFIRMNPLIPTERAEAQLFLKKPWIPAPIHNMDAEICWVLNIEKTEEELLKEMRKTHRYLIKKSQSMGIKVIRTESITDVDRFIAIYKNLAKRKHFVPHKSVREEFEIFAQEKNAILFLAEYDNKVIAGAMIIFVSGMAIYRHGASLNEFRHIPASYLLQWEAIKEAKRRKLNLYNFWGIAPDGKTNHPWSGLTLFKTGFGGSLYQFIHAHDFPLNVMYWKTYAIEYIRKLKRGY